MYLINFKKTHCGVNKILLGAFILISFSTLLLSENNNTKSDKIELDRMLNDLPLVTSHEREKVPNATNKLVCFYILTKTFSPKIMEGLCTHINVAFFEINKENNTVEISDEQEQLLSEVVLLKQKNKDLKILISVGGAGDTGFSSMIVNHIRRKKFIRSCMEIIKKFKIDGVDFDWEWPVVEDGNNKEKIKFVQLLQESRAEFKRHKKQYILSIDVPSMKNVIELGYYVNYIAEYVDFVNIMCYDYNFFTKFHPFTGHNSPLYSVRNNFLSKDINQSIYFWISKSMPREKIVAGIPTYGHTFKLMFPKRNSVGSPARGFGSIGQNGFADYQQICKFLKLENSTIKFDSVSKVPYAYNFHEWISFDNEGSLAIKASYITEQKLGGAMVFSINSDDFTGICKGDGVPLPLLRKIRNILFNEV